MRHLPERSALARWWPLFGVRIITPRLELRAFADTDLPELAELLNAGVHEPDEMPFNLPWTDAPPPRLQRESMQWYWRQRAEWSAEKWAIDFSVREDGRLVGAQGIEASEFPVRRTVGTGSWVSLPHHGRGIGKEMRAAVLHFAFAGLGAVRAETEAFEDNHASLAVTRSLRYVPNGDQIVRRRDQPARQLRFVLNRERWLEQRRDDIELEGLDAARAMFEPSPEPS